MAENKHTDAGNRSVDSLLDRLDALPTPSPVAMRLLTLLEDDSSSAPEVVQLISSDPALASRVVGTCARHPRYRAFKIDTLERAVALLGFDAVRVAALSVRFFETISGFTDDESESMNFDIDLFWRHSLTVAVMAERIAQCGGKVAPATAFLAGLIHDLGHLGLCAVAPRIFQSACEIAEVECSSLDSIITRHLGVDGRSAGRRIGSRWRLPEGLIDVMWLVDQPVEVMRGTTSPDLLMTVSLADALVARDHVCIQGHGFRASAIKELSESLGVDIPMLQSMRSSVFAEVDARAEALGLESLPSTEVLLRSVTRANAVLGRFALAYRDQTARIDRCESDIESLVRFHQSGPFRTISDVIDGVGDSARSGVGGATACVIIPPLEPGMEPIIRLRGEDHTQCVAFSTGMPADVARDVLSRHCLERQGSPVHLELRDGGNAVIVLGRSVGSPDCAFEPSAPLRSAWTAAIDDVLSRERADRLSERLADANRENLAHRETMSQARAAAAIGAIAAGAAHEINNPLAVIMGRSHLLGRCLADTDLSSATNEIQEAARKVSDLVEALSESVAPIDIRRSETDLPGLLARVVSSLDERGCGGVSIRCAGEMPRVMLDPDHIGSAVWELLDNGLRAASGDPITIDLRLIEGRIRIQIMDSGPGFTERALEHAFQPFFSDQPAGRRAGLGLANARRRVDAHGGTILIRNNSSGGAIVTIFLPFLTVTASPDRLLDEGSRRVA
ncbi:MAG: HDOD domain-containing protein [Phycisphaerales bacterium]|nr:HDOD domain-containing protein [Phycisphaerales bacterium]